jgi:DNA-binding NarL/FixJ family response regulator
MTIESHTNIINILIAEEWELIRQGIFVCLQRQSKLNIVGVVQTAQELLHYLHQNPPDLILLDAHLGGMSLSGILQLIRQNHPRLPIILLSLDEDPVRILQVFKWGANGYLLKKAGPKELVESIEATLQGNHYITSKVTNRTLDDISQLANQKRNSELRPKLSKRELEVVKLICLEFSSKEIAAQLRINRRSVESYRERIQKKVGAKNRIGVVLFAIRNEIFCLNESNLT